MNVDTPNTTEGNLSYGIGQTGGESPVWHRKTGNPKAEPGNQESPNTTLHSNHRLPITEGHVLHWSHISFDSKTLHREGSLKVLYIRTTASPSPKGTFSIGVTFPLTQKHFFPSLINILFSFSFPLFLFSIFVLLLLSLDGFFIDR